MTQIEISFFMRGDKDRHFFTGSPQEVESMKRKLEDFGFFLLPHPEVNTYVNLRFVETFSEKKVN